ncbi:MAG: outer membrane protein assembly factor BamA [Endomicrobiales bacterium]|nr:outer membrane protein assembly factor BamA [Endomicrobiales bacterium]
MKIMKLVITAVFVVLVSSTFVIAKDDLNQLKITSVDITGTINTKAKSLKGELKSKVGRVLSQDDATQDVQTLLGSGSFESAEVSIDTETSRVVFTVKEKPFLQKIVIKGNKKVSTGKIKEEITIKEKEYFDASFLEESKSKILKLYYEKGYADVKLEVYQATDEKTNKLTVTFLLTEGNQILIGDVKLEGVRVYKEKKLLGLMKTKKKKVYNIDTLLEDTAQITSFYRNNGYTQASVGDPYITYNSSRTAMFISLKVSEGMRYKVGDITFSGNNMISTDELKKSVTLKNGEIYKEEKFQESRGAIMEIYSDKGYLHSLIKPNFIPDEETGRMNISFDIEEGDVVYLGRIYVDGLTQTKEIVISREMLLKEGDVLSASKVRRSVEKIYNLGFIDSVEPEIQPTEKPDVMDLSLNVAEGRPGMLSAGAGYSSIDQFVGTFQVQHMNLLGRAQKLNLLWEFGATKQNYEISWTEPWFLNKPMSLGLSIFNTDRLLPYGTLTGAYREGRKGGSVGLGPRLNDYLGLLFTYTYEDVSVFDVDSSILASVAPTRDITSSLTSQVSYDTRDNYFDASRGSRNSLSVQLAGGPLGGSVNFIKPTIKSSWFFPTFWKFVLSFNGTVSLVENFSPSLDVPIYERFYIGGADSVRGYQYRTEIGPTNGGKLLSAFNVEYKFPIVQEKKKTMLQGVFFADMGGCWDNPGDFTFNIGSGNFDMKTGVGFGIRFTTPVFPLRLDWGYGLNHKTGEEVSQFYFTIGNIF